MLHRLVQASTLVLVSVTVLGSLGTSFPADLAAHFRVQYLLGALVCIAALAWRRAWAWVVAGILVVLVNGFLALPGYPAALPGQPVSDLRLLHANVNHENRRYGDLIDLVRSADPALVLVQEATPRWMAALEPLRERYPHQKAILHHGGRGMALLSQWPFESAEVVHLTDWRSPTIVATVAVEQRLVTIVSIHPMAPMSQEWFRARNAQLEAVADLARRLPGPRIVVGDFNTTPWSAHYRRLIDDGGLIDARRGFGLLPTWPAGIGLRPLMIPIDHCLVSHEITPVRMRTGPPIGSDHLPLIVDLHVAAPAQWAASEPDRP